MVRYRFWLQSSLSVVLALAFVHAAAAQFNWADPPLTPTTSFSAGGTGATCKVYSLCELGDDPKLCKWIADTIPEMIQPTSWKQSDAKISFYAPSKILVISNTPAVHAQVDEFLQSMKKTVAQARPMATPGLLPAQLTVPDTVRAAQGVQTGPGGYPVPMTPQTPKHLFHFIIRYEGEGIVDSNVVSFAKALKDMSTDGKSESPASAQVPTAVFNGILGTSVGTSTDKVTLTPTPKTGAPVMPPADATPSTPGSSGPWSVRAMTPSSPPPPPVGVGGLPSR
jgi:hypothetical protein